MVPAEKSVAADFIFIAAPKMAEVVGGRKNFKTAAKRVGKKLWEISFVVAAGKPQQANFFPQNLQRKPVGCKEVFSQLIPINQVEQFSVPIFCGSFWKSLGEKLTMSCCPTIKKTNPLLHSMKTA